MLAAVDRLSVIEKFDLNFCVALIQIPFLVVHYSTSSITHSITILRHFFLEPIEGVWVAILQLF